MNKCEKVLSNSARGVGSQVVGRIGLESPRGNKFEQVTLNTRTPSVQGQIDTTENITFPKPTYSNGKKHDSVWRMFYQVLIAMKHG